MLNEAHYKAALNYFYFLLLDEGVALHSALKAIQHVQKIQKRDPEAPVEKNLISSLSRVLSKARGKHWRPGSNPPKSDWKASRGEVLANWKEFMRHSDIQNAEALVLCYILRYPVKIVSEGLDLPEGTVLYRLGRGLESYGEGRRK